MRFQQLAARISLDPQRLFLTDGFGAILSAFLLGVVLVRLENLFGIPVPTLYFLALLPCAFAAFDFYCFFRVKENTGIYLKAIAYLNIFYCFISVGLAFYHFNSITRFGWTYILIEVSIVMGLARFELQTAKLIAKNKMIVPAADKRLK